MIFFAHCCTVLLSLHTDIFVIFSIKDKLKNPRWKPEGLTSGFIFS